MIYTSKGIVNEIDTISGREFELYTGYLMSLLGFKNIIVTRPTGDYGVDVIGSKDGIKYGIQCKNYTSSTVGYHAVEEVCGGCRYYNLDCGIVLTNSTFSPNAVNGAKKCGVCLVDRNRIIKLAQHVINHGTFIKEAYDSVLDKAQKISNQNMDKWRASNKKEVTLNIKQIVNRHKLGKDRDALLGIVREIKAQKHDILNLVNKKTKAIGKAKHKILTKQQRLNHIISNRHVIQNRKIYLTLLKTYHSTNTIFPNPDRINYHLGLKVLTKLLKQMVEDYQEHHLEYVLLDYRRCYNSKESINQIKSRVQRLVHDIHILNVYYTTTWNDRYLNIRYGGQDKRNTLINDPILIKVYNLCYQSHHHCGDKRKLSIIKDYLKNRYPSKEFKRAYQRLDNKWLKQITRTAKAKARNTSSKVSFLPIPQKERISLSLYNHKVIKA